ncbi:MAG: beta-1,4-galactosyltransferase [Dehalococcoidia bacterium]|nr:beta-1,4-galactosyltransferase [Dehalococcoidia bacterium]
MIFVTTGASEWGFPRLVKQADELTGRIDEEVIIQVGAADYIPRNARHFDFASSGEIQGLIEESRLVISHGGVGTILDVLERGRPLIAVPRLRKYGEVIDDHQLQLVQELEKGGRLTAVYDTDGLEEALQRLNSNTAIYTRDMRLVQALKKYVAGFERKPR